MTKVAISRLHFPVTTLGPGRRVGVWFQGCSIRCPGCISVDTWPADRGFTTVERVLATLERWLPDAGGITVSGGEPFDQPEALGVMLRALRERSRVSTFVYSGYAFERLAPWLEANPGLIDALMTEPFVTSLPQTRALRGSDNQRLHVLTDLGRKVLGAVDRPLTNADNALDVMFDSDGTVWFAGIPARGDLARLREALERAGHRVAFTEASV